MCDLKTRRCAQAYIGLLSIVLVGCNQDSSPPISISPEAVTAISISLSEQGPSVEITDPETVQRLMHDILAAIPMKSELQHTYKPCHIKITTQIEEYRYATSRLFPEGYEPPSARSSTPFAQTGIVIIVEGRAYWIDSSNFIDAIEQKHRSQKIDGNASHR
jgi:hypothetical protein